MTSLGFIGLGRMGKNMVLHLLENDISVVGFNRTVQVTHDFAEEVKNSFFSTQENAKAAFYPVDSLAQLVQKLPTPRVLFIMVKAGQAVDMVLQELLASGLSPGDVLIDGGNSLYKDSVRRHEELLKRNIKYIDCGVSGGLEGGRYGASLMIGGDKSVVDALTSVWDALTRKSKAAPPTVTGGRWDYFGAAGAGHFVKMVHNGIEYGIDQAIGEGLAVIQKSPYNIPLPTVAANWTKGTVIRSWLIDLLSRALSKDPNLASYEGHIGGGETGTWTVDAARELGVDTPVIQCALTARHDSQKRPSFAGKVVSALRFEYGGHTEVTKEGT
jgi:6-phosphogluconate dehydrogenase